ncbi:MAG: 30S ribosomal protein S16 [Acidobacteria bacterium]|nr:30S ribosomal protein S16 [Acidobacteriota bacterium]
MLTIRLARTGATKKPTYRVVVIEKARARDGRFVEIVGHYDPRKTPAAIDLKTERVEYWLQKGAQPSETVQSFLRKQKKPAVEPPAASA